MIDFYELLGIKRDATEQEIKQAYRQMAKKYHPDINKEENANQTIISLNEAKDTLLDKDKRKKYDALLDEIKHSKQAAKDKSETYSKKAEEYKETYSESYITRWQYLKDYLKNGLDSKWIKIIKCLFVAINYSFFAIIKLLILCFAYLLIFLESFINYLTGILLFIAILSLIFVDNMQSVSYISFLPSNVEKFLMFLFFAMIIEIIKNLIINKSVNFYVLLQNIEDKIFIFILMK